MAWIKPVHEIALTIKPTLGCNMRCKHCYNGENVAEWEMLDSETAAKFIEIACRDHKDVKVTFHGGEPTLAGYGFYFRIFEVEHEMARKRGVVFSNNITTNGRLLDDKLISLLKENDTLVNISFDGPCNDYLRGYSNEILSNIMKVKDSGCRLRCFCSICKDTCTQLLNIYKWFRTNGISFKVLPIEPRGNAVLNQDLLMDSDIFINSLKETYLLWAHDVDCNIRVYTFEEFAALKSGLQFKPYWFNREIDLNPDGTIHAFGRPNDVRFCIGTTDTVNSLDECFESYEYKKLLSTLQEEHDQHCMECESKDVCNGVCLNISYTFVNDDKWIRYSCRQSNLIIQTMLELNDEIRRDVNKGNADKYNKRTVELIM